MDIGAGGVDGGDSYCDWCLCYKEEMSKTELHIFRNRYAVVCDGIFFNASQLLGYSLDKIVIYVHNAVNLRVGNWVFMMVLFTYFM